MKRRVLPVEEPAWARVWRGELSRPCWAADGMLWDRERPGGAGQRASGPRVAEKRGVCAGRGAHCPTPFSSQFYSGAALAGATKVLFTVSLLWAVSSTQEGRAWLVYRHSPQAWCVSGRGLDFQ